ncbi:ABC transporter substrate-binding protein [Rubripirellula amarantea]|uniref:Bicarbonate transport ATP-binding protein CmpC n=1 Tax=Rubripirellula amarantea TaxID=2527999 RepID=A0A5C5WT93_9BACT|nr:CmpA/NrtA family ABC transporter substrate-binding protein [Rubripirellula amarantea]MDA8744583.1 ABC transporter substrate-binding protein [Rubripirellula amarantea]TWT53052.1 Bicarbonate transport ATP-binding protein CmpC [Rubripirellula amarantea]
MFRRVLFCHSSCLQLVLSLWLVSLIGCSSDGITLEDLEAAAAKIEQSEAASGEPVSSSESVVAAMLEIEKPKLKFGFIKLTDCAPLVIAKEKGYFDDEGLSVEVEAQSNWKILLDRVIDGQLDGAHMLAGQPIGASIGFGTKSPIITAYSLDYNGNGITVSNEIWEKMQENDPELKKPQPKHPISAASLKPIVDSYKQEGKPFNMGMVFPVSTHNYEIRYWLAASGIKPGYYDEENIQGTVDADVILSVTPPPQMPSTLEAGTILGYCVGEPWNQQAVVKGIGVPVTTNYDIWKNNPEKVFGVSKAWDEKYPNTHVAVVKALIRAGKWLDEKDADGTLINRPEACEILSRKDYVGADVDVIDNSMTGTFVFQETDVRPMPEFNVFFDGNASYPHYSDCIWFLTQMRRWGQITESKPASWYAETAKEIYKPAIYRKAAEMLISEGKVDANEFPAADYDGYRVATSDFIDGKSYDALDPIGYINSFEIGNKDDESFAKK